MTRLSILSMGLPMRYALLLLFCLIGTGSAFAQEICNNGIDDDNDGYVDCYDPDSQNDPNCDCSGIVLGAPAVLCDTPTLAGFAMRLDTLSDNVISDYNQLVAGDLDNDGDIEILAGGTFDNGAGQPVYILDGADLSTEFSFTFPGRWSGLNTPVIAQLDNSTPEREIVIATRTAGVNTPIYCYAYDGTNVNLVWISTISTQSNAVFMLETADFDEDGNPEIYDRGIILNGQTGAVITNPAGLNNEAQRGSYAVDCLPDGACPDCTGKELVIGSTVYSVNIAAGTLTARVTANSPVTGLPFDGMVSVADWNLDGVPDGVVQRNVSTNMEMVVYDLQTGAVIGNFLHSDLSNSSRINVANIDGDPFPEAVFKSHNNLRVVDDNFTQLYSLSIDENALAVTPATVFDFNGDGVAEIVHRDESSVQVINATNGTVLASDPAGSATGFECVIVVDANQDGEAEILMAANDALPLIGNFPNNAVTNPNYVRDAARVRRYVTNASPWMPTRPVWNQHAYTVVNIDNDLIVPVIQQANWLQFPAGSGVHPLNIFMGQVPNLGPNGSSSVFGSDAVVQITSSACVGNDVQVSFDICNLNGIDLPQGTPITFYNGDPTAGAVASTQTFTLLTSDLVETQCQSFTVTLPGMSGSICAVVNAPAGLATPFILGGSFPGLSLECDYSNNMACFTQTCDITQTGCDTINLVAAYTETIQGLTVTLTDVSTGPVSYIEWSFGDGQSQLGQPGETISYTYTQEGTYQVCVDAAAFLPGNICCHDTICDSLTVSADTCFGFTAIVDVQPDNGNFAYLFTDLTVGADVSMWDFGDGNTSISTGQGSMVPHTYADGLAYTASLISIDHISDTVCCIDTVTVDIGGGINNGVANGLQARIYPVPANEVVWVAYDSKRSERTNLRLETSSGVVLLRRSLGQKGEVPVSLEGIKPGVYFVILENEDGRVVNRLVKR